MTPVALIIVAAGRGRRLGRQDEKALVPLLGEPLLSWSLRAFSTLDAVVECVVAVPPGREALFRERALDPLEGGDRVRLVEGGEERQDSVFRALGELSPEPKRVLVHDAARALASRDLARRVLAALGNASAVVPALPVRDSVARAGSPGSLERYENRAELLAVQTPQGFHRDVLESAHRWAAASGYRDTDDASLVLARNEPVSWIEGEPGNFKITHPEDLGMAEAILRGRGPREESS